MPDHGGCLVVGDQLDRRLHQKLPRAASREAQRSAPTWSGLQLPRLKPSLLFYADDSVGSRACSVGSNIVSCCTVEVAINIKGKERRVGSLGFLILLFSWRKRPFHCLAGAILFLHFTFFTCKF